MHRQALHQHIAARAAETARALGCVDVRILPVDVGTDGGPEAAARTARYAALDAARQGLPVLIGHTLDDQAEQVLLALARGSGTRSLAGMPRRRKTKPPQARLAAVSVIYKLIWTSWP